MAGNVPRHFWDTQRSSARKIGKIKVKGPTYSKEDVVWHAWDHICQVYFPDEPTVPNGPCFDIDREAYRGLPPDNPQDQVPDIIVVRCSNVTGAPPMAGSERDILWVECKAPDMDKPHEWNRVMGQVVIRLNSAHRNRMVYVILAVGLKWMPFIWDPPVPGQALTNPQNGPLVVLKHNRRDYWNVDPRIYAAPFPGQRHIVRQGNLLVVDTTQAYTLDFWTLNQQNGAPANVADMMLLETCFTALLKKTEIRTDKNGGYTDTSPTPKL